MPQRNWLITGVSSGFGRIMTEQLLGRGDRIAGTVRNLSVMDDLKAKYGVTGCGWPSSTCPR
jgi:short-subunit dehydrogenase